MKACSPSAPPALRQIVRMNSTDSWQCLPEHRKYQERGHLPQKQSQDICLLFLLYDLQQGSCCMCPGSNRKCQGSKDCRALFWAVSPLHPTGGAAVYRVYVSQANFLMSFNVLIQSHDSVLTHFRLSRKLSPAGGWQLLNQKQSLILKYWRHLNQCNLFIYTR